MKFNSECMSTVCYLTNISPGLNDLYQLFIGQLGFRCIQTESFGRQQIRFG